MNTTKKFRIVFSILFVLTVCSAVVGWFLGKDPGQFSPILGWVIGAIGIGEASNVGKRATFKTDI